MDNSNLYKNNDIYVVDAEDMIKFAVLYLCRRYEKAFDYFKEKFSFLVINEKQPCGQWYNAAAKRIIKMLADEPYLYKYTFVKRDSLNDL